MQKSNKQRVDWMAEHLTDHRFRQKSAWLKPSQIATPSFLTHTTHCTVLEDVRASALRTAYNARQGGLVKSITDVCVATLKGLASDSGAGHGAQDACRALISDASRLVHALLADAPRRLDRGAALVDAPFEAWVAPGGGADALALPDPAQATPPPPKRARVEQELPPHVRRLTVAECYLCGGDFASHSFTDVNGNGVKMCTSCKTRKDRNMRQLRRG